MSMYQQQSLRVCGINIQLHSRILKGRVLKSSMSRRRFARHANTTGNSKWIGISNGLQAYDRLESISDRVREIDVYDFTMEGDDTPYIIANGMVIHNCVGKKKVVEMAKEKPAFIKAGMETQKATEEEVTKVWDLIETFGRYGFCLGHAAAYGIIAYQTAYLKANHPLCYLTPLINSEAGKSDADAGYNWRRCCLH